MALRACCLNGGGEISMLRMWFGDWLCAQHRARNRASEIVFLLLLRAIRFGVSRIGGFEFRCN